MQTDDKVRFTLRIPPDLYAKVKESADKNKRSVARTDISQRILMKSILRGAKVCRPTGA